MDVGDANAGVEGHHPAAQLGQVPVVVLATETLWNLCAGVQGKRRSRAEQNHERKDREGGDREVVPQQDVGS